MLFVFPWHWIFIREERHTSNTGNIKCNNSPSNLSIQAAWKCLDDNEITYFALLFHSLVFLKEKCEFPHQASISEDSNYTQSPLSSKSSPQSLRNSILRYVVLASNQVISLEDTAVTQSGNCFLLNRVHRSCKTELHLLQCRHMNHETRELSS